MNSRNFLKRVFRVLTLNISRSDMLAGTCPEKITQVMYRGITVFSKCFLCSSILHTTTCVCPGVCQVQKRRTVTDAFTEDCFQAIRKQRLPCELCPFRTVTSSLQNLATLSLYQSLFCVWGGTLRREIKALLLSLWTSVDLCVSVVKFLRW